MKTSVSSKGQIVLPAEFRQMDRVEPLQALQGLEPENKVLHGLASAKPHVIDEG